MFQNWRLLRRSITLSVTTTLFDLWLGVGHKNTLTEGDQMMNQQYSMQALVESNTSAVKAMQSLAFTSMNAMERMLALNFEFVRDSLNGLTNFAPPASEMGLQGLISGQNAALQKTAEKATAYCRSVYDISTEVHANVSELVSARVGEIGDSVTTMLDKIAQSGPVGSKDALGAVKSAVATTCSAYRQIIESSQQVAEANQPPKKFKKAA